MLCPVVCFGVLHEKHFVPVLLMVHCDVSSTGGCWPLCGAWSLCWNGGLLERSHWLIFHGVGVLWWSIVLGLDLPPWRFRPNLLLDSISHTSQKRKRNREIEGGRKREKIEKKGKERKKKIKWKAKQEIKQTYNQKKKNGQTKLQDKWWKQHSTRTPKETHTLTRRKGEEKGGLKKVVRVFSCGLASMLPTQGAWVRSLVREVLCCNWEFVCTAEITHVTIKKWCS